MNIYMVAFRGGMPLGSLASGYVATIITKSAPATAIRLISTTYEVANIDYVTDPGHMCFVLCSSPRFESRIIKFAAGTDTADLPQP